MNEEEMKEFNRRMSKIDRELRSNEPRKHVLAHLFIVAALAWILVTGIIVIIRHLL